MRLGERIRIETCGGGGYGPPWERDPERVLRDVREEKISPARARDAYGVSVDTEDWTVDLGETARLREKLKARGSEE